MPYYGSGRRGKGYYRRETEEVTFAVIFKEMNLKEVNVRVSEKKIDTIQEERCDEDLISNSDFDVCDRGQLQDEEANLMMHHPATGTRTILFYNEGDADIECA